MHGTYDPPARKGAKSKAPGGKPLMSKKPVPAAPPTPKGTKNGKVAGKPFPAR